MSRGITTILLLLVRFSSMDSRLKKLLNNGNNKRTAGDVEAAVKTNANRVFANVFAFCTHWYQCLYNIFSIE